MITVCFFDKIYDVAEIGRFQIDPSLTNHQTVCMLTSVQAANWWTLYDQCGLSVIRSVILSVSRITAKVIR